MVKQSSNSASMETNPLTCRKHKVYLLAEVSTGKVFYVGMTDDLRDRLRQHISAARTGKASPVCRRIREILLRGGKVGLKTWARNLTLAEASECEVSLILTFGFDNLVNVSASLNWAARHERQTKFPAVENRIN